MASTTFTASIDSFDTLVIHGTAAHVDVRTASGLTEAQIEITGPDHLIRDASVEMVRNLWVLDLPKGGMATSTTVNNHSSTTVISGGSGVFIQAGNINGFASGDVTIITGGAQVSLSDQQIHVAIRLPRGTNLNTELTSGALTTTHAQLGAVHHKSTSGDAIIGSTREVSANTSSGDVTVREVETLATVRTSSGDIDVTGGTRADLQSSSGDIDFVATRGCRLDARTSSGDITVRRSGNQVDSRVRTSSGDVQDR